MGDIKNKLATRAALSRRTTEFRAIRASSLFLVRWVVRMYETFWKRKNRYALSGMISHLGPVDQTRLQNPHVNVTDMYCHLNYFPLCGFVLVSICFGDKLNVSIRSNPKQRTDEKTINDLKENIRQYVG